MPLPNWLSGKRVVPEESMKADGSAAGAKSGDADGSRSAAVLWAIFKPGPRAWQPAETEPLKVEQWQPPAAPSQSPQAMRRYSDHKKVAVTKLHVVVWNVRSFLGEVRADAPRWAARTMTRTMAIVTMATMKNVPLSALEVSFSMLDMLKALP